MISVEILKILGLITICSFVLWAMFAPKDRPKPAEFKSATGLIALGSPAVPERTETAQDIAQRKKAIAEFLAMERIYLAQRPEIESTQLGFGVLRTLRIAAPDGCAFEISNPSRALSSAIIIGDSVAGAGLTPGTAVYWFKLPGEELARQIEADPAIIPQLAEGGSRLFQFGEMFVTLSLNGAMIKGVGKSDAGGLALVRGTPILMRLDHFSQDAMWEALQERAPSPGMMSKVRLFGGFRVDPSGRSLQIVPWRQEPGMLTPREGRLHELKGLLGVAVGASAGKAFRWEPATAPRTVVPQVASRPWSPSPSKVDAFASEHSS